MPYTLSAKKKKKSQKSFKKACILVVQRVNRAQDHDPYTRFANFFQP